MGSGEETATSQNAFAPATAPNNVVPPQSDRTYVPGERIGLITAGMSPAQIENLYGSDDFVATQIDAGEGTVEEGYLLFPKTPDEVTIRLGADKQPALAILQYERATWYDPELPELGVGANLQDVISANGRDFIFRGFGWDYGGTVSDWRGGKLSGMSVRLSYAPERLEAGGLDTLLLGDVPIRSDDEAVQHLDLRVRELGIDISKKK
jgi:hypothetical protein